MVSVFTAAVLLLAAIAGKSNGETKANYAALKRYNLKKPPRE